MSCIDGNVVNFNISYKFYTLSRDLNTDFILGNCLFGAVKLTKNANSDKYGDNGYGIGFNARSQLLWSESSWGKNVVILGTGMSSLVHVDNKKRYPSSW